MSIAKTKNVSVKVNNSTETATELKVKEGIKTAIAKAGKAIDEVLDAIMTADGRLLTEQSDIAQHYQKEFRMKIDMIKKMLNDGTWKGGVFQGKMRELVDTAMKEVMSEKMKELGIKTEAEKLHEEFRHRVDIIKKTMKDGTYKGAVISDDRVARIINTAKREFREEILRKLNS